MDAPSDDLIEGLLEEGRQRFDVAPVEQYVDLSPREAFAFGYACAGVAARRAARELVAEAIAAARGDGS